MMMDEDISDASFRTRPPDEMAAVQVPMIQPSPPMVLPLIGMQNSAGDVLTSSPMTLQPIVGAVEALGQRVEQGLNAPVRADEALQRTDVRLEQQDPRNGRDRRSRTCSAEGPGKDKQEVCRRHHIAFLRIGCCKWSSTCRATDNSSS